MFDASFCPISCILNDITACWNAPNRRAAGDSGAVDVFKAVFYLPPPRALNWMVKDAFGGPTLVLQVWDKYGIPVQCRTCGCSVPAYVHKACACWRHGATLVLQVGRRRCSETCTAPRHSAVLAHARHVPTCISGVGRVEGLGSRPLRPVLQVGAGGQRRSALTHTDLIMKRAHTP